MILPSPFIPFDLLLPTLTFGAMANYDSALWPGANRAIYTPYVFPAACTLTELRAIAGNSTGNYDLGVYDADFTRLASKGTTAMASGVITLSLSLDVEAGTMLYAAITLSSASGSQWRATTGSLARLAGMGVGQESSALPLPATMTPVAASSDVLPLMAFGLAA